MEPKKISVICLCFLLSLFLTQAPELAVIISLVVLIFFFKVPVSQLSKFAGILILTFLLFPIVGVYFATIAGYVVFLFIFDKLDEDRYAFGIALLLLVYCSLLLVVGKDKSAETSAIFAYLFLVVGSAQKAVYLMRGRDLVKSI